MWYNGAGGDFLTHLLVVDDEVSILELIKNSLGKDGYLITVCQNADDVDIKKLHFYDLILLDVMMPGTDGFEFCKQIRNMVDCPILFLTAKTLEEDILFGLGIGADDYITKPFRIQELRARVAAHLRREKREHHSTLSFEPDIRFDLSAKVLYVSEQPVPLTKSEYSRSLPAHRCSAGRGSGRGCPSCRRSQWKRRCCAYPDPAGWSHPPGPGS